MSTTKERFEVINRVTKLNVSYEDACALRRISLTLQRWFEMECGTENSVGSSVHIEREGGDDDGRPFVVIQYNSPTGWKKHKRPCADREKGARRRLAKIMARYPELDAYVQTDCRGAALYLLRRTDYQGQPAEQAYHRGIAIY